MTSSSIGAASKSPVNWSRNTTCTRQNERNVPNAPNLKGGLCRRDVKHQIGNTVKAACYGYRFQSFGEYKALLAAYNVCAEEVKGEINGKPYQALSIPP